MISMPELAEVETVRNTLKGMVLNKKIVDVNIIYPRIIESDITDFKNILINKSIVDINRKGKYLFFDLNDYVLISHLRMEGKYFVKPSSNEIEKHEHVIISFDDKTDLRYHDTRKFGRMNLVKKEDLFNIPCIKKLGIDANDFALTKEYVYEKIHNKHIPIKTLLLDQSIISGLGNIYANEVLFASHINPERIGASLSLAECESVARCSKKIIDEAIKCGGTTIKSYTSSLGVTGRFQQFLNVHKKENEPCPVCNTKIVKMRIGGRSTYYCPNCQR